VYNFICISEIVQFVICIQKISTINIPVYDILLKIR